MKTNEFADFCIKKAELWAEINFLEKSYDRLNQQIFNIEKDKNDTLIRMRGLMDEIDKLNEQSLTI